MRKRIEYLAASLLQDGVGKARIARKELFHLLPIGHYALFVDHTDRVLFPAPCKDLSVHARLLLSCSNNGAFAARDERFAHRVGCSIGTALQVELMPSFNEERRELGVISDLGL